MAGEWLKFEKATPDKPEVFAAATALGIDPDAVVGKLIRVWSWFDTHTVDGNARSVTPALLDRVAGVAGFAIAMANVGWLVISDEGVTLPKFGRHTGETAKGRALSAKRSSAHREKSNGESHAESVTEASPREEKKREEIEATPVVPEGDFQAAADDAAQIVAAYHAKLPRCQRVGVLTPKRQRRLKAVAKLSRQVCREQGWKCGVGEFFDAYFGVCAEDPWMRGDVPHPTRPDWKQNIEVLLAEDRFAQVMDKAIAAMKGAA